MLRRRLTIPAAIIVLALCFALAGIGYWAGHTIISSFSNQLVEHFVNDIDENVRTEVERSQRVLSRVTADITRYDISLDDPRAMRRELYAVLTDEPNIERLFFANEAGGVVGASRLPDGALVFLMTDGFRPGVLRQYDASADGLLGKLRKSSAVFDARQTPWYQPVKDTHGWYLTAPYRGPGAFGFRVSLAAPILSVDGRFANVIGTDRLLTVIARDIRPMHVVGRQERSFIIDSAGQLIASSGMMSVVRGPDGSEQRALAADTDDPVVRGTARYLQAQPKILRQLQDGRARAFSFNDPMLGETYVAVMSQAFGGSTWIMVSAVPASDFLAPTLHALTFSIVMSLLVVAVALALGNRIAALAFRPLTALTETARAITRGEWPDIPDVQRNDEIGLLARAFKGMIASLKDT
jgi:HAMP domain-containing protein